MKMILIISLIMFGMILLLPVISAPTVMLQDPNTENLEDTYVWKLNPTTNYGSNVNFLIREASGYESRGYVMFNLSQIPSGSTIDSATLYLYDAFSGGAGEDISIYHINNYDWEEGSLTWNSQLCGSTSGSVGGNCNISVLDTQAIGFSWNDFSVTPGVKHQFESLGKENITFMLYGPDEGSGSTWISGIQTKESSFYGTDKRIYLNVTYTEASDTCSCPGLNQDWEIDNSDSCVINDACDLGTGKLSFINTGTTICNATVNTSDLGNPGNGGILQIDSNCLIWIN